jgi:hypothetical protein
MDILNILGIILLLLSLSFQDNPIKVKLLVNNDGLELPANGQISIFFVGKVVRLAVHDGIFEVPPGIAEKESIACIAEIDDQRINLGKMPGEIFMMESWKLIFASGRYDEDYDYLITKGAKIRESCILVLNSARVDSGNVVFIPHCRRR